MAQQQLTSNDYILEEFDIDLFKNKKSSPPAGCRECQRICCICDMNTSSSLTLNSEDSFGRRQDSTTDRYFSESEDETEEDCGDASEQSKNQERRPAEDICWEDWPERCNQEAREAGQSRDRSFRAERSAAGKCPDQPHNKTITPPWRNPVQSPLDGARRQTPNRPIMLHPRNLFDSDLRVFFIRTLRDVRVFARSESLIETDIEFHPYITTQGLQSVSSWAACVTPLPASSPYFSEVFTYCMVKGGSVDLCLQAQKPLVVSVINGSACRDAVIYAGNVIAVLEICCHRY